MPPKRKSILPIYSDGDMVFAKVKGFPFWPARVEGEYDKAKQKYKVFFFGTHEIAHMQPKEIVPFEENKHRYGMTSQSVKKKYFKEGLLEMRLNPKATVDDFVPMCGEDGEPLNPLLSVSDLRADLVANLPPVYVPAEEYVPANKPRKQSIKKEAADVTTDQTGELVISEPGGDSATRPRGRPKKSISTASEEPAAPPQMGEVGEVTPSTSDVVLKEEPLSAQINDLTPATEPQQLGRGKRGRMEKRKFSVETETPQPTKRRKRTSSGVGEPLETDGGESGPLPETSTADGGEAAAEGAADASQSPLPTPRSPDNEDSVSDKATDRSPEEKKRLKEERRRQKEEEKEEKKRKKLEEKKAAKQKQLEEKRKKEELQRAKNEARQKVLSPVKTKKAEKDLFEEQRLNDVRDKVVEKELINVDVEIKRCLNVNIMDIPSCSLCLDRLEKLTVNQNDLLRFPDILRTLKKVRMFKHNAQVAQKAGHIYEQYKTEIFKLDIKENFGKVIDKALADKHSTSPSKAPPGDDNKPPESPKDEIVYTNVMTESEEKENIENGVADNVVNTTPEKPTTVEGKDEITDVKDTTTDC